MSRTRTVWTSLLAVLAAITMAGAPATAQQQQKPNILFIMGDDVGWFNVGAYHQGIMSGKTPNLDKLASEGMRFTDYYAEASCTAGRPTSLLVNCQSGLASRQSDKPVPLSGCRRKRQPLQQS